MSNDAGPHDKILCSFDVAWVGKCQNKKPCEKHSHLICSNCDKPATRQCTTASSLMCGAPLCSECKDCNDFRHKKATTASFEDSDDALDDFVIDPIGPTEAEGRRANPLAPPKDPNAPWGDQVLKPIRPDEPISPRHRKLAELAALGMKPGDIAKEMGYTNGRISVLLSNSRIRQEISEIQDRAFEGGPKKRLKELQGMALDAIELALRGGSGMKAQQRVETAKWLIEQFQGKAVQKHDVGENILSVLLDRIDVMKQQGQILDVTPAGAEGDPDVTESPDAASETLALPEGAEAEPQSERDRLADWVTDFDSRMK